MSCTEQMIFFSFQKFQIIFLQKYINDLYICVYMYLYTKYYEARTDIIKEIIHILMV